ncbi:MAG: NAD(P)/FAD-dependent oxidoreductase [Litoreibacter sp.]|nr:NAD(P)/FAD-dependent oxidoreductase [Litoreibacter sp.]
MSLQIGIAGAGIGGLAAGALLAQAGHQVRVFDQFDAPKPVGSGLVIQPVGLAVLDAIGAGDTARVKGNRITRMLGHEAESGRPVLDVWYDHSSEGAVYGLAIHRASLFEAILEAALAAGVELVPNHAVLEVDGGAMTFEGQPPSTRFDLVIDASGAGSVLSPIETRPLPYGAIWGTVPWPDKTALPTGELRQCYRRADRMIGVMPCGTLPGSRVAQTAIFWSLPRGGYDAWSATPLEAWRTEAEALWPEVAPFLAQVHDHDQMTMARYSHGTLRTPFGDRLAFIGDSAHRASPQLGQGANMALLDAFALTQALAGERDIQVALLNYARARRAHIWVYQAMSWAFTPQYQSDSRWLPKLRDHLLFPLSQIPPVPAILNKLVCGNLLPPVGSLAPRP